MSPWFIVAPGVGRLPARIMATGSKPQSRKGADGMVYWEEHDLTSVMFQFGMERMTLITRNHRQTQTVAHSVKKKNQSKQNWPVFPQSISALKDKAGKNARMEEAEEAQEEMGGVGPACSQSGDQMPSQTFLS